MPDLEKKKQDEEQPDEATLADAQDDEVKSDVPPLDEDPDPDTDKEESPPDLVPNPEDEKDQPDEDKTSFDDEKTEQAINEIMAKEGDELLAVQDAAAAKGGVKSKTRHNIFHKRWVRRLTMFLLVGGVAALAAAPYTRYWILNTAGVRSSSSVIVLDSTTQLPLKGVHVSIGGHKADTDSDGKAKFKNLRLGPTKLSIVQVGFEEIKRNIVIGWGSNPLGNFALKATGVQYIIEVRDYLSEKPVEGVEATDGVVTAISGKDGKITFTLPDAVIVQDGVSLSKTGYRTEKITLNADPKQPKKVMMVLARKAVFVTKASGKYDVYKSDIDGQNREVLLAGTGSENSNISLAVSPDGNRVAYVSTRENKRDEGGFLLSTLVLINVENGQKVTIAESSQIQLIDWMGQRLVFQQSSSGSTSGNRYTVLAYNYTDNTRLQLAAANNLSAVMSAQGAVYYAVGADSANPSLQLGLFKINPDGNGKQRVFDQELTTVLRSAYGTFSLQVEDGTWYTYDIVGGSKSQTATPSSLANRLYEDNADRSKSLWVSQATLKSYDIATNKDTDVKMLSGVAYPAQWLSNTAVIYRVSSGVETADYAVSLAGGTAHKVADVSATYGFSWGQ